MESHTYTVLGYVSFQCEFEHSCLSFTYKLPRVAHHPFLVYQRPLISTISFGRHKKNQWLCKEDKMISK